MHVLFLLSPHVTSPAELLINCHKTMSPSVTRISNIFKYCLNLKIQNVPVKVEPCLASSQSKFSSVMMAWVGSKIPDVICNIIRWNYRDQEEKLIKIRSIADMTGSQDSFCHSDHFRGECLGWHLLPGAIQSACTHFMTPRPENGQKIFWWTIGVQNDQGTHRNWF